MADSDTLDHRAELMRVWSADRALMAQAGLLQADISNMHLGPAAKVKTHSEKLHATTAGATATIGKKKKNKSKAKTSDMSQQKKTILKELLLAEATHNHTGKNHEKKKHKQNGHINSNESAHELDEKVSEHYQKYKTAVDEAFSNISRLVTEIPVPVDKRDAMALIVLKKTVATNLKDVNNFLGGTDTFSVTFIKIAEGVYRHITTTSTGIRYNHKLIYSPFFNFATDKLKVMRKGYFVHEILTMVCFFLMRNMKVEGLKEHKEKIQEKVHELLKYKRETDKIYSQLIKLKQGLDFKARQEKHANEYVDHSKLKNLREDMEESLHHDGTFRLSQPYDE